MKHLGGNALLVKFGVWYPGTNLFLDLSCRRNRRLIIASRLYTEIVQLLLQHMAYPDAATKQWGTAAAHLCQEGQWTWPRGPSWKLGQPTPWRNQGERRVASRRRDQEQPCVPEAGEGRGSCQPPTHFFLACFRFIFQMTKGDCEITYSVFNKEGWIFFF